MLCFTEEYYKIFYQLPLTYKWELGILTKNLLMNESIKILKNPFGYVNKLHTRKKSERSSDIVSKE
jgi:hypothetical protein